MKPETKIETTYTLSKEDLGRILAKALNAPEGKAKVEAIHHKESDDYNRDSWDVFDGIKLIITQVKS